MLKKKKRQGLDTNGDGGQKEHVRPQHATQFKQIPSPTTRGAQGKGRKKGQRQTYRGKVNKTQVKLFRVGTDRHRGGWGSQMEV